MQMHARLNETPSYVSRIKVSRTSLHELENSMPASSEGEIRVFVCYSHADKRWLDRLLVHLAPLKRRQSLDVWSDRSIQVGTKWRDEIRAAIERCNTAVLLISADFLASEFIANDELPPLLQAADERGALIIPVIIGPCLFLEHEELTVFQAANDPSNPLICVSEGDSESVFRAVAITLMDRINQADDASSAPAPLTEKFFEDFLDHETWTRLVKIGNWVYDNGAQNIVCRGTNSFLLSRNEYGSDSYSIEARLTFFPDEAPLNQRIGFNAGLIVGWTHEKKNPRYYNLLLTGQNILLERVGFKDQSGRSAEHLSERSPLKIIPGQEYIFRVEVAGRKITAQVDGKPLLTTNEGPRTSGRVGIRPWRSTLRMQQFLVQRT